jgi:hypothetical protein
MYLPAKAKMFPGSSLLEEQFSSLPILSATLYVGEIECDRRKDES